MLVIRRAQMEAFANVAISRAVDDFVTHAAALWPEEARRAGGEAFRKRVDKAVRLSVRAGLDQEHQVHAFLRWTFLKGDGFDADPAVAAVLETPLKDGELKVIEINDLLGTREED